MLATPFFPAWRPRLAPMGQRFQQLRRQSLLHLDLLFGSLLPSWLLAQADEGPNSREQIYSVRRTFFGFLYQVLNPDCPCRQVVRQIQSLFALISSRKVSDDTGAYCLARARLPLDILSRLRCAVAAHASKAEELWNGLRVKVLDGTAVSMPDTPKNQRAYPQSDEQKPGCGFPFMKIVGIFSLSTGVLLDYARGNKHQHELSLLHRLLDTFKAGDLALADRGFSCYTLLALLWRKDVPALMRLHHARNADLRQGKRLGKNDRLILWHKPKNWGRRNIPTRLWKCIAAELPVRVLRYSLRRPGYRTRSVTLVTTLLDLERYPAEQLALLYARRWQIELWFRDLKTSMGMDVLRCQSPKMIHKELEMFFIAYNLIRCLMLQASRDYQADIQRLSFKGTVDSTRQFAAALAQARSRKKQNQLISDLLRIIAADLVPDRPNRREPRAVKRRPNPCAYLTKPRHKFKDAQHRNRYWKSKPRKLRT
ncbi:MAG TPA: IS4 family transposase [Verrucomicrobiae bacterium]|nr:IS4 family transposase [Verrucomicrobiae bacterium]